MGPRSLDVKPKGPTHRGKLLIMQKLELLGTAGTTRTVDVEGRIGGAGLTQILKG